MIRHDYEGISDNPNMVVVIEKKYLEEKHSGAAEPTGSTDHRGVVLKTQQTLEKQRDVSERNSGAAKPTGSTKRDSLQMDEPHQG